MEQVAAPEITQVEVQGTYTNLATGELPDVGRRVEFIFVSTNRVPQFPLHDYSLYKGEVVRREAGSITLALGAECKYVYQLLTRGFRVVTPNLNGEVVIAHLQMYDIYWRYEALPLTTTSPTAQTFNPMGSTTPLQVKQHVTPNTPASVAGVLEFGGKRTKRRKSKRKSRRKK